MNPMLKQALVWAVEYVVAHEAGVETLLKEDKLKVAARAAIAACKELLPLLQNA